MSIAPISYEEKVAVNNYGTIINVEKQPKNFGKVVKLHPTLQHVDCATYFSLVPRDILGLLSRFILDNYHSQYRMLDKLNNNISLTVLEIVGRSDDESALNSFMSKPVPKIEYNITQATLRILSQRLPLEHKMFSSRIVAIQRANHIRIFEQFLSQIGFDSVPKPFKNSRGDETTIQVPARIIGIKGNLRLVVVESIKEVRIVNGFHSIEILTFHHIDHLALKTIKNLFIPFVKVWAHTERCQQQAAAENRSRAFSV